MVLSDRHRGSLAWWGGAAFLVAVGLLARIPFVVPRLDGRDEVDLALGVTDFDLEADRPHFPGYPLLILAARVLLPVAGDEARALGLLAAIASIVAAVAVADLARSIAGSFAPPPAAGAPAPDSPRRVARGLGAAGLAAGLIWLASPLAWTLGTRALSDAPGVAAFAVAAALLARGRSLGAGLVLGAGLGLRPSLAPVAIGLLGAARPGRALAGLGLGVAAWLVPLVASVGLARYVGVGAGFIGGHFGRWGGSALTDASPLGRPGRLLHGLGTVGLGLVGPGRPAWTILPTLAAVALGVSALRRLGRRAPDRALVDPAASEGVGAPAPGRLLLWLVVPWVLWALAAQNLERPRHVLPLLVPLAALAGAGVAAILIGPRGQRPRGARPERGRWPRRGLALAIVLGFVLPAGGHGLDLAREQRDAPAARVALARWASARLSPSSVVFGAPATIRVLDWHAARVDRAAVPDEAALEAALHGRWVPPGRVLATNEVVGDRPSSRWRVVARFARSEALDGPEASVVLLERVR